MTDLLAAVSDLLGERVELLEYLSDDDRRNTIVRVRVAAGPEAGSSLIVKQTKGFGDPSADEEIRHRLYQEATASLFLTRIAPGEYLPRCHGVDPQRGLMIFDDLGDAPDLAGALLGSDGSTARAALLSYVGRLGALHAATAGRLEIWDDVVAELGAPADLRSDQALPGQGGPLDDGVAGLDEQLPKLGLPAIDASVRAEVAEIRAAVCEPGPFTTLVHRDSCPDNVMITAAGARLIDFEFARPGHALLDGLYPQLPFPTCWCCNRLPDDVEEELAAAYRTELIKGVPEAADDEIYDRAVSRVMAYWLLGSFGWVFADAFGEPRTWGIASIRSRMVSRLQVFVAQTGRTRTLPGLRALADGLLGALTRRWPEDDPLPIYPAFRPR